MSDAVSRTEKKGLARTQVIRAIWIKPAIRTEGIRVFEVLRIMRNAPHVDADYGLPKWSVSFKARRRLG